MTHQAAGVFFYSKSTQRYLYLLRTDSRSPTWSIPGGGIEQDETLFEGISRECDEEMSFDITELKLIPIQKFVNNNFVYHTFYAIVPSECIPVLNHEHCGYAWVDAKSYPKPLHRGVFATLNFDIIQEKIEIIRRALK